MRTLFLLPALLAACGDKDDSAAGGADDGTAETLHWYATCGDPSCAGYQGPTEGLATCTDQAEGASCEAEGAECDLENDCNQRMLCTTEDPKASEYGCPQSRAAVKTAIAYLDPDAREQARAQLLQTRLATWRYTWESPEHKPHLGFLIDDQPGSAAVHADGARVDLYGYTSLTVAAVQAQDAELQQLRSELDQTRAELASLRAELARLQAAVAPPE
jgi:hypothetical protein